MEPQDTPPWDVDPTFHQAQRLDPTLQDLHNDLVVSEAAVLDPIGLTGIPGKNYRK